MANRKEVFLGAYAPQQLKSDLASLAAGDHRTLSQEIIRRLTISVYGSPHIPEGGLQALQRQPTSRPHQD